MDIYFDIDGVLLTKRMKTPKHSIQLIEYCTVNHNCLWLTTHCRHEEDKTIPYLEQFYTHDTIKKLKQIKPTYWDSLKTEAINFNNDFLWLDDYPLEAEKKILHQNNKIQNLITVDLTNQTELLNIISVIKSLT